MAGKFDHKQAAAAPPPSKQSSSRYRDDPDAVSMHTTRSDYEYDDVPSLPSYEASVGHDASDLSSNGASQQSPRDDTYQTISVPQGDFTFRSSKVTPSQAVGPETSMRMDDRLLDPIELHRYIRDYLRVLRPKPTVRIQGWHWENKKRNNKNTQERVYDFDIVIDLQTGLPVYNRNQEGFYAEQLAANGDKRHRGTVFKVRARGYTQDIEVGSEQPPKLEEWCERFCESKAWLKVFRVSRSVVGMDEEQLKRGIQHEIRSTHYRGHVDITFPIANKNVDIYNPHWINSARISWIRWIFYLTFLWIFTWPILFFLTKKWSVYNVEWRFSVEGADGSRQYASISESQWIYKYGNLIKSLALDKFHGDGSDLPLNPDVDARIARARGEVPQSGNRNVDTAVQFVQGGLSVWNTLNGRSTQSGWGADESSC